MVPCVDTRSVARSAVQVCIVAFVIRRVSLQSSNDEGEVKEEVKEEDLTSSAKDDEEALWDELEEQVDVDIKQVHNPKRLKV